MTILAWIEICSMSSWISIWFWMSRACMTSSHTLNTKEWTQAGTDFQKECKCRWSLPIQIKNFRYTRNSFPISNRKIYLKSISNIKKSVLMIWNRNLSSGNFLLSTLNRISAASIGFSKWIMEISNLLMWS